MVLFCHQLMEALLPQALDNHIPASHVEERILIEFVILVETWSVGAVGSTADTVLLSEVNVAILTLVSGYAGCEQLVVVMIQLI